MQKIGTRDPYTLRYHRPTLRSSAVAAVSLSIAVLARTYGLGARDMSSLIKRLLRSYKPLPRASPVIVGITRFSVDPSSIISDHSISDIARMRSSIFTENRLAKKLLLFRSFTIPSLAAASLRHKPFYHLVVFSSNLPPKFRKELEAILNENSPWMRLVEIPPGSRMVDAVRNAVHALGNGMPTLNFRIDDDDAICPDFADYMRDLCLSADDGTVISFDIGYYLQRVSASRFLIKEKDYPKIAIGLGVYRSKGFGGCVFDLPVHTKISEDRIVHVRENMMWIRTIHGENDSGTRIDSRGTELSEGDVFNRLKDRFGFLPKIALSSLPVTRHNSNDATKALFHIQ